MFTVATMGEIMQAKDISPLPLDLVNAVIQEIQSKLLSPLEGEHKTNSTQKTVLFSSTRTL